MIVVTNRYSFRTKLRLCPGLCTVKKLKSSFGRTNTQKTALDLAFGVQIFDELHESFRKGSKFFSTHWHQVTLEEARFVYMTETLFCSSLNPIVAAGMTMQRKYFSRSGDKIMHSHYRLKKDPQTKEDKAHNEEWRCLTEGWRATLAEN